MIFCFQGAHRGCWIWKEALLQVCAASLVASYQNKQRWKQLPSQYPIVANKNDYHLDRQVLQGERVGLLLPGNCRTSGRQLPSPLHRPGVYFAENISPTIFHSSSTHSTPSSSDKLTKVISIQLEFNCNNLPFLSYDSANNCPAKSALGGLRWFGVGRNNPTTTWLPAARPSRRCSTRSTRGSTPSAAPSCSGSPSCILSSSLLRRGPASEFLFKRMIFQYS